jgi:hypothetical protein
MPYISGRRKYLFILKNHFAKLYDGLKFLQIWQPRHGGLKGNCHGPRRQGGRQLSAAGSGARGQPTAMGHGGKGSAHRKPWR